MGKLEKVKNTNRRIPFYKQLSDANVCKPINRFKMRNPQENKKAKVIDSKCTQKILTEAQRQLEDIEEEFGLTSLCTYLQTSHVFDGLPEGKYTHEVTEKKENFSEEDFLEELEDFQNSIPESTDKKNALIDLLREKITEKRTEINTIFSDAGNVAEQDERVLQIFKDIAVVLSLYRAGPLPKPFKALPKLRDWERLLYLTQPDNWTAAAMFQATRLFASSLKSEMAERFYKSILLPRVRDDIAQCKKLNPHLYMAVKKAIFKPRAFYKGIIIPLCESENCTLQEASILSSIISKCSIPVLYSSIALCLISKMPFSCANCMFMRVLLEKKYQLYIRTIDDVVNYFLRFAEEEKQLPEIWHQTLLTLVENYKENLSQDQKKELLHLLKYQKHHKITPEISKQLLSTSCQNTKISIDETKC